MVGGLLDLLLLVVLGYCLDYLIVLKKLKYSIWGYYHYSIFFWYCELYLLSILYIWFRELDSLLLMLQLGLQNFGSLLVQEYSNSSTILLKVLKVIRTNLGMIPPGHSSSLFSMPLLLNLAYDPLIRQLLTIYFSNPYVQVWLYYLLHYSNKFYYGSWSKRLSLILKMPYQYVTTLSSFGKLFRIFSSETLQVFFQDYDTELLH